jgi:hypothetical protein
MKFWTQFALCAAVPSACAALGCGSSAASRPVAATRVYTGKVDGTDAQVAIVATSRHARIYFCGGDTTFPVLTRWFAVDVDPSGASHAPLSDAGAWSLDAQLGAADANGAIVVADGTRFTFRATPAGDGTIAGLYEAPAPCGKVGLIVSQSSAQSAPTGQGACIDASSAPSVEQVNPIMPLIRVADGSIRVQVLGATGIVAVRPAAAPLD